MDRKTVNTRKSLIVLNLAAVAFIIYIIFIYNAFTVFQQTRIIDPLAEIHALSPLYYAAIILIALLSSGCVIWRVGNKYLHILLLMLLAIMLWLTPYCLSGFVRLPDAPWHVGVATQIPQVLAGHPVFFSGYAVGYPGSFIYHFLFLNITGIQPLTYIQFFPLFSLLLFILLCYTLLARLTNPRAALLALLLAIPGLHYLQLHASPHVVGTLLMLTVLVLLKAPGTILKIVAIPVIAVIIVSHPTTPLLLAIFLAAAWLVTLTSSRRINRTKLALASILVITCLGWLAFYPYALHRQSESLASVSASAQITSPTTSPTPASVTPNTNTSSTPAKVTTPAVKKETSLIDRLKRQILPADFDTSQEYVTGTPFIYENIYSLNKGVYVLYAMAAVLLIIYIAVRTYLKNRQIGKWLSGLGGLKPAEVILIISVPLLLILTFLLAEGAHDLIETGLTFLVLALSGICASVIIRSRFINSTIAQAFIVTGVLFLNVTFPIVAYSIDAYSNYPKSEEAGLEFLVTDTSLEGKTVAGGSLSQLALFAPQYSNKTRFISLTLIDTKPDLAVFRNTRYFYSAIRSDRSFSDNSFTRSLSVAQKLKYNKIYTSPTFLVYSK